ncbi:FG-GAP-like repeat-containing protein [Streptomyces sp. NPDC029004]|uniref:FG-GAP-like repeat-containing protein n=1 Tax=Streptomyces sp. NPDC029004 TaxID=3154490 RepID=UPI0033EA1555
MTRRPTLRRAAATAVVVSLGAGLCAVTAPAAVAADDPAAQEVVIQAGARFIPRDEKVLEAGSAGFLHQQEGTTGKLWTDYATGTTRPAGQLEGGGHSGLRAAYSDGVPEQSDVVRITDLGTGEVTSITLPLDYWWADAYNSDSALAYRRGSDGRDTTLSVFRVVDGQVVERPVSGLPMDAVRITTLEQDTRGGILKVWLADGTGLTYLIDYEHARLMPLPQAARDYVVLGDKHVLIYPYENATLTTVERDNPAAEPITVQMPAPTGHERTFARFALVGDWIVFNRLQPFEQEQYVQGTPLKAMPVGGGPVKELLPYANEYFATAPDGSVLATGGTGSKDWAVRRITTGPDGTPQLSVVKEVPPVPAKTGALALGGGKLSYISATDGSLLPSLYDHDVAVTGTPEAGERTLRSQATGSAADLRALGDGRSAFSEGSRVRVPLDPTTFDTVDLPSIGRLADATGRYTLSYAEGNLYIGDLRKHHDGNLAATLPNDSRKASIWGSTLWRESSSNYPSTITWYDVKTKKTSPTFFINSGCSLSDLQAVGRWIYWSCNFGDSRSKAGVWDQKTRQTTRVPFGPAKLGDGFLVRKDNAAGKLLLTDVRDPAALKTTEFADVPADGQWTVDKFGGHVAYTDAEQRIHIKPVTVPRSPIGVVEGEADTDAVVNWPADQDRTWDGSWQLTRPAVRWSVVFKDAAGRAVRTISSTEREGARITATWDGKGDDGTVVLGGRYGWTLSVDPGDGSGARAVQAGQVRISGGATPFRDYNGDGVPELLTKRLTTLTAHEGMSASADGGSFQSQSGGWAETTHVLPFGDMDGDRCNDMVVRTTAGDLYRYSGRCHGIPAASAPKAKIGSGFNAFDALVTPGDLTGDGRSDLLARVRATGALYLYADNGAGGLKAGVKLSTASWKGLTLIGAGDLNGDGHGDLLARDAGGELWRYDGTGTGTLKPRVLVFSDWGAGRNAFVGVGDLDGDGRNDLVSRDTAGRLLRNSGDGKGSFRGTVQIGTGWQRYTAIY